MPNNNNQGRLLNDGLNTSIFAKLETVKTPAGTIADMQYPSELGSDVMQNFLLITAYNDKPSKFQTQVKAQSKNGNIFGAISAGLGGSPGSAVNIGGSLVDIFLPKEKKRSNESFVATTRIAGSVVREPQESIALYIPGQIEFSMSATYEMSESERRGWGGKIAGWGSGLWKSGIDFFRPGGAQNRLLSQGQAKNPNKEVSFTDIKERSFTFEYAFIPKSPRETEAAFNIIRTMRWHAHPSLSGDTMFNVPSEFEIQFFMNGKENPYIPRMRRVVCTSFNVKYGDDDGFVSFEDGAPAYIEVSMGFQEVEPLHQEHIEAGF